MWLCQYSTYFSSLFRFRLLCNGESGDKQEVLIKTNIDEFLVYLEYLEGGTEIACANVLPLYKAALYFGGGRSEDNPLLDACQKWLVDCVETEDIYDELVFVNLLNIWIYGFVNDIHWMWSTCQNHITKNFMWASADKYFVNAPLELVLSCIRDPDLVVDSERYLCEVLLMWLSANNATTELLQEVRGCNLPLQFIMANLKELADVKDIPDAVRRLNDASEFDPTTLIRLSKFSERMNLEGCAMITSKKLFQSLLPYSKDGSMEAVLIPDFKSDFKVSWPDEISLGRFTKMVEVDISKCHKLDLVLAINCFRRAFPNLAKIKMRHFWNFDPIEIYPILLKCDLLEELDCSIDKNPLRPGSKNSPLPLSTYVKPVRFPSTSSLLRLKKLTLEGRTDLTDHSFDIITEFLCLHYLNIKGCLSLTDKGIGMVLRKCRHLKSILAGNTALSEWGASFLFERHLSTLAIGGCQGISEASMAKLLKCGATIKILDLSETRLNDAALRLFEGSNLVTLDLLGTKVSQHTVLSLLKRNSNLEELRIGWGFPSFCLDNAASSFKHLKSICLGLGASFPSDGIVKLSHICPKLESIDLKFQHFSHKSVLAAMKSFECLATFSLSCCKLSSKLSVADLAPHIQFLVKLKLERVAPFMSNLALMELSRHCPRLVEIYIVGSKLLDTDSMEIISSGWPGIIALHLEECGEVTSRGVSTLYDCKSMERLHLRHNGSGIAGNFIVEASSRLPLLRCLTVDRCDFVGGHIDLPIPSLQMRTLVVVRCRANRHTKTHHSTVWEWSSCGINKSKFRGLL